MTNLDSILKSRGLYSQSYGFSSSHVRMWELDHKEGWVLKNWCFQTVLLEKTLESPLDCKEIKPVNPKGNQPWIFIGRTDTEAETPILWPPDAKSQLIGKDPDAGKDWRQEEKGVTEDEMVGWHHWLKGHEFEQALGTVKDREAWHAAVAESDMTERLNSDNQESYSTGNKWAVHISHFLSTFVCSLTFPASSLMASIVQNAVLWSRA